MSIPRTGLMRPQGLYTFRMAALPDMKAITPTVSAPTRRRVIWSAARYLAGKVLTILATIFVAVLITMVIVDIPVDVGGGLKMSPFQMRLESQIYWVLEVSAVRGLIPTGNPYPGERMQKIHPTTYMVSRSDETIYTIACQFGDMDPLAIAQANGISVDSALSVGQQLSIP